MSTAIYTRSAVVGTILLLLTSCGGAVKDKEAEQEENLPEDIVEMRDDQIQLAGIELGSMGIRSLGNVVKANGVVSVEPRSRATVCMPLGGFVRNTSLVPGNPVRKGQVLAVMESQEYVDIQQDYLETRNRLTYAGEEFKRHTELYKDDVYSQKNVQQVTVEYKNLQAKARSLEEKLRLIGIDASQLREDNISSTVNLLSPISGFLTEVNVNIGKYVEPADVLFGIVNSDRLYLELTIFEKDAGKVQEGQKLSFFISNETEEHEAVITQTGKSLDEDKSLRAYALVKSACPHLIPGMYVNALIRESDNMVTALPDEAVVSFDDRNYIFVFERNKEEDGKPFTEYRMLEVGKGVAASGYTQVIMPPNVSPDSVRVVLKGAYNLLSAKKNAGEMAC